MFITHSSVIALVVPPEEIENDDGPKGDKKTSKENVEVGTESANGPLSKIGF